MSGNDDRREPSHPGEPKEPSWELNRLPWTEAGRLLARDPRLILPVGVLEQHGPHLPIGANLLITERVAREVSRARKILLAPAFPFGVGLPGFEAFAGTAGLRRKTFHRALNELLAGWEDHGVREFLILTAHHSEAHLDALLLALTSEAVTTVVNLFSVDVSDLVEAPPEVEHAGELETSLLLYLAPELVRPDRTADFVPDPGSIRRYFRGRVPTPPTVSQGVLGRPSRASRSKGEAVFRRYVAALLELVPPAGGVDRPPRRGPS